MVIAMIADEKKEELLAQFCIAYCGVLSRQTIYAPAETAKYISDATGLNIEAVLSASSGGIEQITSRAFYDEIDILFCFRDTEKDDFTVAHQSELLKVCDAHDVPTATNPATAEVLIRALENGDLDYRKFINPVSEYNINKKNNK